MAALLAGCGHGSTVASQPTATRAWVRLAAVPGRPAAGYFTLTGGDRAARLTGVSSPLAARAELHQGGMVDGMMTMRPLAGVDLLAHASHAFAPGGDHIMLFGVDPRLRPGDALPLTLSFAGASKVTASARVIAAGDSAPAE